MSNDWQFVIVMGCVLLAVWSIGRRVWRMLAGPSEGGSCGSCSGCSKSPGSTKLPAELPLVQLELVPSDLAKNG